jgi:hypothetical protein
MAAECKVYQLDSLLTPEERQQGTFHYRWIRLHESRHGDSTP